MTGKTQSEAVALLKSLPLGSKVKIVVSRQEDVPETVLPRIIVSIGTPTRIDIIYIFALDFVNACSCMYMSNL